MTGNESEKENRVQTMVLHVERVKKEVKLIERLVNYFVKIVILLTNKVRSAFPSVFDVGHLIIRQ